LLLLYLLSSNFVSPHAGAQGRASHSRKISRDLLEKTRGAGNQRLSVIVQLNDNADSSFDVELLKQGSRFKASLTRFHSRALELPAKTVDELAARSDVRFVSLDRETIPFGHVTATTGADTVRVTSGTNTMGLDGSGIGIAVLDSGIDANHTAFLDRRNHSRVIYSRDFTGEDRTDDPYGHGTHVASIAAGNARISNGAFTGIAPNANLINLRVLNAAGSGNVSTLPPATTV
jgi:subtilisin family serine protease